MLATVTLALSGVVPTWPGLLHAVALPPLDLAVDVRVLVARASGYPQFVLGVAAAMVLRTAVLGTLFVTIGVAPSPRAGWGYAARLYAIAVIPITVAGGLEFAGLAALYAWYAWIGLGVTLFAVLVLAPRRLARPGTRLRRYPVVLGYLAAVTAVGALARLTGTWGALIGVAVSGALTAVALSRLVRQRPRHGRGAAAATALLLLAPLVPFREVAQAPVAQYASLLVVPGVDTATGYGAAYRLDASAIGFPCDRVFYFSYLGPGEGAPSGEASCPIRLHRPYGEEATQRPLGELVDSFALQVEAIRQETGGTPIVVVTHSQGAAIAWESVVEGRATSVSHLIALAGFPHSPVGYPPPGADGPGRVGADALRVLSWFTRLLGVGIFDPDAPLARELLARPEGLEAVFGEPVPSTVDAAVLFATADVIAAPEGHAVLGAVTAAVDATHVGMVGSAAAEAAVRDFLAGRPPAGDTPLAAVLDAVLPAFMPPPA